MDGAASTRATGHKEVVMGHIQITSHYEAPIDHVFEMGIDFKRYPEWNVNYEEVKEVVGPPDQVGTRIHSVMKLLGRQIEGWGEITQIEKPRLLKFEGKSLEGGYLTSIYRLTPAGTGTDVALEFDYELTPSLLAKVTDKLFLERAVERDLRHSIENFKAFVEAKAPQLV